MSDCGARYSSALQRRSLNDVLAPLPNARQSLSSRLMKINVIMRYEALFPRLYHPMHDFIQFGGISDEELRGWV